MGIRGHSGVGDRSRARDCNGRAGAVLLVHPSVDLYGSDRVVLDTAASLESHDYSVVLVLPGDGPLSDEARCRGVTTIRLSFPALRKGYLSPRGLAHLGGELVACAPRIVALLRSRQWDAVVVNTLIAPWWVVAARAVGIPVVCHVHEAETDLSPSARRVILAPLLLADVVIANSRATAAFVDSTWTRLVRSHPDRPQRGVPALGCRWDAGAGPGTGEHERPARRATEPARRGGRRSSKR